MDRKIASTIQSCLYLPEGTILNAAFPAATTYGNHLCPANADAVMRAMEHAIPDRVTAGWNHLLCTLTPGLDPRKGEKYVDICFMGLKGGSGAMKGVDGYDHIGMIDASGGLPDQDYEMFEQQLPPTPSSGTSTSWTRPGPAPGAGA